MFAALIRLIALTIVAGIISGCGVLEWKEKLLDALVSRFPTEMEVGLGKQILPSVLPNETILRDAVLQSRLEKLLKPLIERNRIIKPTIQIYISRRAELNAFALPGGILIFNAGMLAATGSPEEILGVAAHELAHVTKKHVLKSMIQRLGLAVIVGFFLGDVSELSAYLIQKSQMLLQNGFTRTQETEADQIGFDYLVTAGIHPKGMGDFFQRLQRQKSESSDSSAKSRGLQLMNTFLSTHPLTVERISMVERRVAALTTQQRQKLKPVTFDLKSFQKRIIELTAL